MFSAASAVGLHVGVSKMHGIEKKDPLTVICSLLFTDNYIVYVK